METTLRIEGQKGQIKAHEEGNDIGELTFKIREDGIIVITHTLTYEGHEGRGVGKELMKAAVEYAQKNSLKIYPLCSFARYYIERKPELRDLLV